VPLRSWLFARDGRTSAEVERDIEDELAFHLEMRERELVESGMSQSDARRGAEERFGDVVRVRERCRTVQMGDRIMLQRAQLVLMIVLVVAVLVIGLQSFAAQSSAQDEIGRMSDEIRRLTAALQRAPGSAMPAAGLSDPLVGARETASRAVAEDAPAAPFDVESESARWLARFEQAKTWRHGLALGEELSELPDDRSLAILERIYAQIPAIDSRQQLLKSFVFDGAKANACEVLHLAATDRELAVQKWAFNYLKSFALRDFSIDPDAYAVWRAANAKEPMPKILARSAADLLVRMRGETGTALRKELEFAARADLRVLAKHLPEEAFTEWKADVLGEAERGAASADGGVQEGALELATRIGVDEQFRRRAVDPLLEPGCPAPDEVRAAAVRALASAPFEGQTARLVEIYERESSGGRESRSVTQAALHALARSKDAHAIPELIRVLVRNDAPAARRDVGSALESLTGVPNEDGHDGEFWIGWFAKNKKRLPEELRAVEIVRTRGG
jgi:hypothetical protein